MAEEKFKEKELILENKRFTKKYGLSKKALEKLVQHDLKFRDSFEMIADYLQQARILIIQYGVVEERKTMQLIERAKYVLRGCKE